MSRVEWAIDWDLSVFIEPFCIGERSRCIKRIGRIHSPGTFCRCRVEKHAPLASVFDVVIQLACVRDFLVDSVALGYLQLLLSLVY